MREESWSTQWSAVKASLSLKWRGVSQIMLTICFIPFLILFLTLRIRPFRWARVLWTYVLPVVPFVLWFDGWISCLRSYSHEELSELVRSLPEESYRWELGTHVWTNLLGAVVAVSAAAAAGTCHTIST